MPVMTGVDLPGKMVRVRSRVWSGQSRALTMLGAGCVMLGLVWLTVWLLGKGNDGAGIANVLALPTTVVGSAAAVYGLRVRPRADDPAVLARWARVLLQQVITAEQRALQQLLGDIGDPRPADVTFVQPSAATLRWRTDGGSADGSLDTIASYYSGLTLGRLIVLGETGAGKTVIALRLLLDLAMTAHTTTGVDHEARVRVPVRLSLPAFVVPSGVGCAGAARVRLDAWVARHLTAVYRINSAVATALVTDGWILPLLDGLDEMDPDDGPPERAQQVLAALNHPAGPARWPTVLTCRTTRYRDLSQPVRSRTGGPLQDATAVEVQPLGVEQVIAWLAHRFPDPSQPDRLQQRWRRVASTLRRHASGRLADCLTSPLNLYLATTVYQHPHTSPRELCDLDPIALKQHLLDNLIPALTQHYPRPDHTQYDPIRVQRWLKTLADHVARMSTLGNPTTDIRLHHLWRTTGHPRGRCIRQRATALAIGLVALPIFGLVVLYAISRGHHMSHVEEGFVLAALLAGLAILAFLINLSSVGSDQTLDRDSIHVSTRRGHLAFGIFSGLVAGFAVLLAFWPALWLVGVLAVVFGLTFALVSAYVGPRQANQPSAPIRQQLASDIVAGLSFMLMGATFPGDVAELKFLHVATSRWRNWPASPSGSQRGSRAGS